MLSKEDNELITRVGPGAPMGRLLREYWIPALQTEDLSGPDSEPKRVRLLCEDLVAFRDSNGNVGLVAENCPHRGASLFFGRNEEAGLRCVYHGWKFDTSGACVDMPNEPPESNFKHKVRVGSYPCVELNGIIWTYMGPRKSPPPLPEIGWSLVPATQRQSLRYMRACNWLQALEGDIDSSHINYLHSRLKLEESLAMTAGLYAARNERDIEHRNYFRSHGAPTLHVLDTEVGVTYGARRPAGEGQDFWRITQFLMPFYTSIPGNAETGSAKIWVPLDDDHVMIWEPSWSTVGRELSPTERSGHTGRVPKVGYLPNTSRPLEQWVFAANKSNEYLIDRQVQKTQNYTGLDESNPLQDGAVQESMGTIFDRSREHLGTADGMIIRTRRRLLNAAKALRDRGETPPGVDAPETYRRRGVQLTLPTGANWIEATQDAIRQVVPA
jgi:phenylpropionate dioxygenase-like ring-hydroxylating dioxygenase large terminal subunit